MPHKLRHRRNYNIPGHAHELTFSCFHGNKFMAADRCREWLRDAIEVARRDLEFDLWAYVFMPEHVHLIVHPRRKVYEIEKIRESIKGESARQAIRFLRERAPEWLSRIAVKKGDRVRYRFWQAGGGYDRNIDDPRTLLKMIDYIHMNPVRRGLVEYPEEWKWSSAAWYLKGIEGPLPIDPIPPDWLAGA